MKIKTVKKMRLDELIKYVFDNGITGKRFEERMDYKSYSITHAVHVTGNGVMNVEGLFNPDTKFTAEVEEELTEDTEFEELWESYWNSEDSIMMTRSMSARMRIGDDVVSINGIKSTSGDIFKTVAIFYKDTLIWSAESGIPESGVLEVDAE